MARSPCSWRAPAVMAKLEREMSGLVGYARVSTRDQDYDGQIVELKAAGFTRIPLLNDLRVASNEPPGFQHLALHLGQHTISYSP